MEALSENGIGYSEQTICMYVFRVYLTQATAALKINKKLLMSVQSTVLSTNLCVI